MAYALPTLYLLLELAVCWFAPPEITRPGAYLMVVFAAVGAAAALGWRAWHEHGVARLSWLALACAQLIWSFGAFGNFWYEHVLGSVGEMYRAPTLAFNLAAVPLAFVLACDWQSREGVLARWVDAGVALALGVAYFLLTWALLTARGLPDNEGVIAMVWLIDAQNLYLLVGAWVRWRAAASTSERTLFGAMGVFESLYLVLIVINNHFIAPDASLGPEWATPVTLAFAALAALALRGAPPAGPVEVEPALVRTVRTASPVLLAGALLLVSLVLIRHDYVAGVMGVLIAVMSDSVRSIGAQVRSLARGDHLQREQTVLQTMAATDALTGIPNRRFLDPALDAMWRQHRESGRPMAVLMIDIDLFKAFNDRFGHPAGDACLRAVASALQGALVRGGDVLVRYGGEEFIVLLHDAEAGASSVVGERLRAAVQALGLAHPDNPPGVVTISVGVASTPGTDALSDTPVTSVAALVQAADQALYVAKQAGRNRLAGPPPSSPSVSVTP